MITFEYNGKIYKPSNLENKLKNLGITINDIKIIDNTKTNAEKEKELRIKQMQFINDDKTVDVYWDNYSKGWYIVDRQFPYEPQWDIRFFHEIENGHYKLVQHDVNKNGLQKFFKENFKAIINNK